MSRSKEILKQVWVYTSAFALTQFVSVVGAIITRHFLGPLQTGVWSLVQVILNYTDYANMGVTYAIPIEIPFKRGQGKIDEAEKMKDCVFSFSFLTSVFFAISVMVYAFWQRSVLAEELFYGLIIASGIVVLQQMNNILISLLRAYKNFQLAGSQMAWSSIVNLVLVTALSSYFKLYGFMTAMALSFIFNISYVFYHENFRFRWVIDLSVLKSLMAYGLPLMILTFASTLLLTIDKIMIARYLGLADLGLYSIAVMTCGFVCSVPNAIGVVLLPNLSEKLGQTDNISELKSYFIKANHVFAVLMPLLIGFAWFLVPLLISLLIPKFENGLTSLRLLALGTFFIGLTQTYSNFIVVNKKHWKQFPLTVLVCLVAFGIILVAIQKGMGIEGVAVSMSLAMFINFTVLYFFAGHSVMTRAELWLEYFKMVGHFLWMVSLLYVVFHLFGFISTGLRSVFQTAIFTFAYIPLVIRLHRHYGVFSVVLQKFFPSGSREGKA